MLLQRLLAAEIFADGDIFHLGRDDAFAGIVHLADIVAGPGAQRALDDVGEGFDALRTVGAGEAVVLGLDGAAVILLDIATAGDPFAAERGEAGHDVDAGGRIGVGAGAIIDAQRRLAAGRLKVDLAHGHPDGGIVGRGDVDLAAATDRAGGDLELGTGGDIGHYLHVSSCGRRTVARTPSLRPCKRDQVQRVAGISAPPLSLRLPGESDNVRRSA